MSEPMEGFDNGDGEYVAFSEEALQFLPQEWRDELQAQPDDSRGVLKTVDKELSALSRLSTSLVDMVTLKYVQGRLTAFRFSPTMAAVLELDMLTTAFVVTRAGQVSPGSANRTSFSKLRGGNSFASANLTGNWNLSAIARCVEFRLEMRSSKAVSC